ncbi:MAG: hypothetical protein WKF43_11780 [Acidimicrobiales bacterium]
MSWLLLAGTLVAAGANWVAVATGNRRLEYIAKPATMVLLIGVALSIERPASDPAAPHLVRHRPAVLSGRRCVPDAAP